MIYFACKTISMEEIVRCSFNINKTEYKVLVFLLRHKQEYSVQEIAEKLGKERTTIQKAIKSLLAKGLLFRRQVNLDNGGYVYYYSIKNKEEIKKRIIELVDSWTRAVKKAVESW